MNTVPLLAELIKYMHSIGGSPIDRQRLLKRFEVKFSGWTLLAVSRAQLSHERQTGLGD